MNPANEPTAWSGAITALFVAGIPLLRAFHVSISEDQSNAILGFLAALILVATILVRSQVTPTHIANAAITEAFHADPKIDPKPAL